MLNSLAVRASVLCVASLLVFGCSKPKLEPIVVDAVPKGPKSVAEGVERLGELRNTIKAAFDAGTPRECDEALHEAFDITTNLQGLASDEGFTADALETVKTGTTTLVEKFMKIHDGFHGQSTETEGNVYETVADDINKALEALASVGNGEVE